MIRPITAIVTAVLAGTVHLPARWVDRTDIPGTQMLIPDGMEDCVATGAYSASFRCWKPGDHAEAMRGLHPGNAPEASRTSRKPEASLGRPQIDVSPSLPWGVRLSLDDAIAKLHSALRNAKKALRTGDQGSISLALAAAREAETNIKQAQEAKQ